MKIRIAALLFTGAFLIQGSLLNLFAVMGVTPNLLLCLVITLTLLYDTDRAIYLGAVFGVLYDLIYSDVIGVASIGLLIVGFLTWKARQLLNRENILSILILSSAGTLIYNLLYWGIVNLFRDQFGFLDFLKLQPGYVAYNMLVMILLYLSLINRAIRHRNDRYYK